MSNLLSIGLSGLSASQAALNVTGNNITNADTAGYTRKTTEQVAAPSQRSGNVYIGSGTTLTDVRRMYSSYLGTQVNTSTSLSSDSQSYYTQIQQVNSLLADSTTGISTVLQSFFTSLQTAAASPTDAASRQLLLTQSNALSSRFNAIYDQLADQNGYINEQLGSMTNQVNKLASNVAQYNLAITQAASTGATPNDLLDARDETVRQLNELIGVSVVNQDGNYNLYIGSGQPLVVGNSASTLNATPSQDDPTRYALTLTQGSATRDVTSAVTGGEIGGLLRYRTDVLDSTMNELGRMALVVSDAVNSQLGQGLDLKGEFGAPLFGDINSATLIAQRSLAQEGNSSATSNFNVTIKDSGALTTSDYEVTFTDSTHYTVTRSSDGAKFPSGNGTFDTATNPAPVVDGFSLQLTGGNAAAGDTFTIIPTRTAAGSISTSMTDAGQLAFAAPLAGVITTGNYGSGAITQPTLTTKIDITNPVAQANMQASLKSGMPVKMVFDAAGAGTQGYNLYDSAGNNIGTGTIVPGNNNTVTVNVAANPPSVPSAFSFETSISGKPGAGDSFTFSFNANGTADNRNAQSLLDLQTKATIGSSGSSSGKSFVAAYSSLIEQVGAKTNQAKLDASATSAILTQAKSSWDSYSGVNLDEEAANLIKFEQYYNASSQIIQIARSTFDTLINSF
ncbi:flagellar hook-associated protein FlgK [Pseudomonas kuykendallii]|uniref:Flagellar hook-associated protein 1 n=1 Tax=Pseudomonas kuykendallii TaxID=1007099 RepID=A0A2W5DCX8_9PSED|nr:flagellar hook-associated protein FlgK [Pseudomonas kuykendallii]PZP26220.1 MAG: flagellar hook-associated protein FlgK [Pseudomonas kuykendallii]